MKIDIETKIASWVFFVAFLFLSVWLFITAVKGIALDSVPSFGLYSSAKHYSGTKGLLIAISYIGFSLTIMLGAISIKRFTKRNRYLFLSKCLFILSIILLVSTFLL